MNVASFFIKALRRTGYIIAAIIIIAALLVSATRLATPWLNERLPDFEAWANDLFHEPVKIRHVEISWDVYTPEIAFEHVAILDKKTHKAKFAIQRLVVHLNVLRSLLEWKPVTESIKVVGAHFTIRQPATGNVLIDELKDFAVTDDLTGEPARFSEVLAWVFSQRDLVLEQVDIDYYLPSGKKNSISLKKLVLQNSATGHQLKGKATLNQDIPMSMKVRLNWVGNILDLKNVSAKLYVYLEGVSLPQWFSQFSWHKLQVTQGLGSARVWLTWDKNQLQQVQSRFQFYDLGLLSTVTQKSKHIPRLSGHVGWKREGDKQVFAGEDILLDLPSHLWPITHFNIVTSTTVDNPYSINSVRIGYLDLNDVKSIALLSGLLPESLQKTVMALDPVGEIRELNIASPTGSFSPVTQNKISANLMRVGVNAWEAYPGIKNLTGILNSKDNQGSVTLKSQQVSIVFNKLFEEPLQFEQLTGEIGWKKNNVHAWVLNAKAIQVTNSDLNANANVELTLPEKGSPLIDLSADFNMMHAGNIKKYLPLQTFDKDLATWAREAIEGGTLQSGKAILKGKLADFPFENNNGSFLISGEVKDLILKYAPDWPIIQHMNGVLTFSGSSMTADVESGLILEVPLTATRAVIPYIGEHAPQVLTVTGLMQTDFVKGLNFVRQSPLQKKFGDELKDLQLTGPMQLKLNLTIPLKTPDDTKVQGDITTSHAVLDLPLWSLKLEQLTGLLRFTESSITAPKLQGLLFNEPFTLSLLTQNQKGKPAYLQANLSSTLTISHVQDWFKIPLLQYAEGSTKYAAELRLAAPGQSQATELTIKTNLEGVAVKLPAPYNKKAQETTDLKLNISAQANEAIKSKIQYGKLLSAAMKFKKSDHHLAFDNGELRLGGGEAEWQMLPGLIISARFKQLDWEMLQPYYTWAMAQMPKPVVTTDKAKPPIPNVSTKLLRSINLQADTFRLFGQSLAGARFQLSKSKNDWLVNVNSTQVQGVLTVPANFSQIQGKFHHIYISDLDANKTPFLIDPKTLPALIISAGDVRYTDKPMGNVYIETSPTPKGLHIKELEFKTTAAHLQAGGSWELVNKQYSSHLDGEISSTNLSRMLVQWGVNATSLLAKEAHAEFDLSWLDAPYSPAIGSMSGDLSIKVGRGRIVHLSGSTEAKIGLGRLLSILSLQSIPRRLSLNFSDLFQNGYSFDSIVGHFKLQNGNAFTPDLRFAGPVARIDIAGRIGLQAKDYDLKLGVTTYVTSSLLPVAAGVIFPPAALPAWVLGAMMSHATSKNIAYQYQIRGPWDNPIWEQIGASTKRASP